MLNLFQHLHETKKDAISSGDGILAYLQRQTKNQT